MGLVKFGHGRNNYCAACGTNTDDGCDPSCPVVRALDKDPTPKEKFKTPLHGMCIRELRTIDDICLGDGDMVNADWSWFYLNKSSIAKESKNCVRTKSGLGRWIRL